MAASPGRRRGSGYFSPLPLCYDRPTKMEEAVQLTSIVTPGSIAVPLLGAVLACFALIAQPVRADDDPPYTLLRDGFFYVGGTPKTVDGHTYVVDQMYVEFRIPAQQTHPYPIVMVHGGTRTGTTYTGT